ncbi:MAG: mechanosensitive ion channel domain-containing protein [Sandaracinaceae bacterium]
MRRAWLTLALLCGVPAAALAQPPGADAGAPPASAPDRPEPDPAPEASPGAWDAPDAGPTATAEEPPAEEPPGADPSAAPAPEGGGLPATPFDRATPRATPAPSAGEDAAEAAPESDPAAATPDAGVPPEGPAETLDAGPEPTDGAVASPDAAGLAPAEAPEAGPPEGATEASEPRAPSPSEVRRGLIDEVRRWLIGELEERDQERQARRRARAEARAPDTDDGASLLDRLGLHLPEGRLDTLPLLLLLILCLVGLRGFAWAGDRLPVRGLLPALLAVGRLSLRTALVVITFVLTVRLLPPSMRPAMLLAFAAAAVALGWGVWLLLPDAVGALVLIGEGRVRPGLWVAVDGVEGQVQRIGARLTTLRSSDGTPVRVPNRSLLRAPLRVRAGRWPRVTVDLRGRRDISGPRLRETLRDAVLTSPYVSDQPELRIGRLPDDPEVWRVEVCLLDHAYVRDFEGQLLDRWEEALAAGHGG